MNEDLKKACDVLRKGGLILYPTDTIWGIGCDATNKEAVQRVYTLKQRADNKAMLLLLGTEARMESYVQEVPEIAWSLIEVADRPLTLIYPGARNLAPNLIAEDGSVGIRITREEFSRRLCEQFRRPVVSTSANISGQPAPHIFQEIAEEIKQGFDYIVQYRQDDLTAAQPSSIIKLGAGGLFQIIR